MSAERLRAGAKLLGELWDGGTRCGEGWVVRPGGCGCTTKTKFCKAKAQWMALATEEGRAIPRGEFTVLEVMKGSEWDATGRTVAFDIPGEGVVKAGPKGRLPRAEMVKMTPETLSSMLKLVNVFPGSTFAGEIPGEGDDGPGDQFPDLGEPGSGG